MAHVDAAYAVQANDGSAHYAVIIAAGTHLQFNDTGCNVVTPACYEPYGWVINDGTQYHAVYLGTCNSSSTLCHVKDGAGYCWTATKPANGLWATILNITDASIASANGCANLPGPTSSDRASGADSFLNALVDLVRTIFDEGVVTGSDGGGTGALPFQFNAAATGGPQANALPFGDRFADAFRPSSTNFNFKVDLGRTAERLAGGNLAAYADGAAGAGEGSAPRDFIPWVTGRYINFSDGSATDRAGYLWAVTSGATVRLGEMGSLGAFGRYRQGKVSSTALDSSLDSRFYGGGAFAQLGSEDDLKVKIGGLYEFGQNDIVTAGDSGNFATRQWSVEGRAEKRFMAGLGWFTPLIGAFYSQIARDGYTDSGGNVVAAGTRTLGQLTYGSSFGVSSGGAGGVGSLFASVNGIWNFERADDTTLSSGTTLTTAPHLLALGLGFEFLSARGASIHARGDVQTAVDGALFTQFNLANRLTSWSVTGGIGVPMGSRFGKRTGSKFNFDVATSPGAASGKAKLVVPLN